MKGELEEVKVTDIKVGDTVLVFGKFNKVLEILEDNNVVNIIAQYKSKYTDTASFWKNDRVYRFIPEKAPAVFELDIRSLPYEIKEVKQEKVPLDALNYLDTKALGLSVDYFSTKEKAMEAAKKLHQAQLARVKEEYKELYDNPPKFIKLEK